MIVVGRSACAARSSCPVMPAIVFASASARWRGATRSRANQGWHATCAACGSKARIALRRAKDRLSKAATSTFMLDVSSDATSSAAALEPGPRARGCCCNPFRMDRDLSPLRPSDVAGDAHRRRRAAGTQVTRAEVRAQVNMPDLQGWSLLHRSAELTARLRASRRGVRRRARWRRSDNAAERCSSSRRTSNLSGSAAHRRVAWPGLRRRPRRRCP